MRAGTRASKPYRATPAASSVAWSSFASDLTRRRTSFHARTGIFVGEAASRPRPSSSAAVATPSPLVRSAEDSDGRSREAIGTLATYRVGALAGGLTRRAGSVLGG